MLRERAMDQSNTLNRACSHGHPPRPERVRSTGWIRLLVNQRLPRAWAGPCRGRRHPRPFRRTQDPWSAGADAAALAMARLVQWVAWSRGSERQVHDIGADAGRKRSATGLRALSGSTSARRIALYRAWPAPVRRVSLDTLKQRFTSGLENSQYLIALSRARI
jgi:hypothetical protein